MKKYFFILLVLILSSLLLWACTKEPSLPDAEGTPDDGSYCYYTFTVPATDIYIEIETVSVSFPEA